MKLCIDCIYCEKLANYWCNRPIERDLTDSPISKVTGKIVQPVGTVTKCYEERLGGTGCGDVGRYWTPTRWKRFKMYVSEKMSWAKRS